MMFTQILDVDPTEPRQELFISDFGYDTVTLSVGLGPAVVVRKCDVLVAISGNEPPALDEPALDALAPVEEDDAF